jgi:hypothetical protein
VAFASFGLLDLRPTPALMRALRVSVLIFGVAGILLFGLVGAIETVALGQPTIADGPFVHPHEIKGRVRFFTDRQERIYVVAKSLMVPAWAVALTILVAFNLMEERRKKQAQQELLERIANEG